MPQNMDVLDQPLIEVDANAVKFGGFWLRLGALIIDTVILAPISFGVMFFNITSWKSPLLLIIFSLIAVGYKPAMERYYGATLGKMALKLRVVNLQLQPANLTEIVMR